MGKKSLEESGKDAGPEEATIAALTELEVDSVSAVASLREEDTADLKLKLGQHRLLCPWIRKLSSKSARPSAKAAGETPHAHAGDNRILGPGCFSQPGGSGIHGQDGQHQWALQ